MKRYYKLTQIRKEGKEEIYFIVKRGKLEILYHSDLSHAKSSSLEKISKDEIKVILGRKQGLDNLGKRSFIHL